MTNLCQLVFNIRLNNRSKTLALESSEGKSQFPNIYYDNLIESSTKYKTSRNEVSAIMPTWTPKTNMEDFLAAHFQLPRSLCLSSIYFCILLLISFHLFLSFGIRQNGRSKTGSFYSVYQWIYFLGNAVENCCWRAWNIENPISYKIKS